jgi:hypothetical protein
VALLMAAVVIVGATTMTNRINATQPPAFDPNGKDYALDLAILPFATNDPESSQCAQLVAGLPARMIETTQQNIQQIKLKDSRPLNISIRLWPTDAATDIPTSALTTYETTAVRYANEHKVDLAIYGTVECSNEEITVRPHFYVAPSYINDPGMLGNYDFGPFSTPIRERNDILSMGEVDREMSNRASALALLSIGLEYYARHTQKGYLQAAELFSQIISNAEGHTDPIYALAHTFMGSAYLNASIGDCGELNQALLQQAFDEYSAVLQFQSDSPLAYLGLGNVMNLNALFSTEDDLTQVREHLRQGEEYRQRALALASGGMSDKSIEWRVLYARAQAKLIERDFTTDTALADLLLYEAEQIATNLANNGTAGPQRALAARTFLMLGDIFHQQDATAKAIAAYETASRLIENDPRLSTDVALKLADLLTEEDDICGAAAQYQQAMQNTTCEADRDDYSIQARDFQIQCKAQLPGETVQSSKVLAISTATPEIPADPFAIPDADSPGIKP